MSESFLEYKKRILTRVDKSSKQSIDKKIIPLYKKINQLDSFVTTSSCAGRIVLSRGETKKEYEWLFVSHTQVSRKKLLEQIQNIKLTNKTVYLKCESFILHVSCDTLASAQLLIDGARMVGLARSSIIESKKHIVVELVYAHPIVFVLFEKKKQLYTEESLQVIVTLLNRQLRKTHKKIKEFETMIEEFFL
ncbi:MAG: tRNA-wybutosine modification methyltransferase TYW3 [Candidatus Woesearchaeota archaeon]